MPAVPFRRTPLGERRLVALTCWVCGKLQPGDQYGRSWRGHRSSKPYLDRRCRVCRWARMEANPGR